MKNRMMLIERKKEDKYFGWLKRKEKSGTLTHYDEDNLKKNDVLDIIVLLMKKHKVRSQDIEDRLFEMR